MLKRHLELKLVKTPTSSTNDVVPTISTEEISQLATDIGKKIAVTYVVAFGASVVLYALGQIAIIAVESKLND